MQCIFPKSRTFVILITFLDDSKIFYKIPIKQKGSTTLTNIANSISLCNSEHFGLKYFDRFQKPHWINLDKSVYRQLKKSQIDKSGVISNNEPFYNVEFEVRYYPRDPTSINNEHFRYQIFLQIRKDLRTMKLIIKDETMLSILCGLILQSDFGDYSGNRFAPHYIRQTISSHLLSPHMEEKIKSEHIKLKGVEPIEAEYRFLEKVRWLENYGTIIFPVKDINNKYCYLGLNPQGFSLRFYKEHHLNYEIFWPRICAIRRSGRQIIIKEKSDVKKTHFFETGEKLLCVVLHQLCMDHFAFFKLKKDEKPLVSEPPKRSFGRSYSKEFGYSSDTSDNNQYSDDTFSSYPDSINTTQSSKVTKGFKKTIVPLRNCVSDIEESALSRKNRRVIVSISQTETEDETLKPSDLDSHNKNGSQIKSNTSTKHSQSYDRIPPDYIYENRLSKPNSETNEQLRQKRIRKRISNQSSSERKYHLNNDDQQYRKLTNKSRSVESNSHTLTKCDRNLESRGKQMKSKTNGYEDSKNKESRQLPHPAVISQLSRSVNKNESSCLDYSMNQSASVDSISTLVKAESRIPQTKRKLPNLSVIVPSDSGMNPPIPQHRVQPKPTLSPDYLNKNQSVYTDIWYKPLSTSHQPNVSKHSNLNYITINKENKFQNNAAPTSPYQKSSTNYSKKRTESGI